MRAVWKASSTELDRGLGSVARIVQLIVGKDSALSRSVFRDVCVNAADVWAIFKSCRLKHWLRGEQPETAVCNKLSLCLEWWSECSASNGLWMTASSDDWWEQKVKRPSPHLHYSGYFFFPLKISITNLITVFFFAFFLRQCTVPTSTDIGVKYTCM